MAVFSGFVLYTLIWWMVFFTILPWGNRRADIIQTGNAGSAPARANMKTKVIVASIIAAILVVPAYIEFHKMLSTQRAEALKMAAEDDQKE
jgi:predicted secreted protein